MIGPKRFILTTFVALLFSQLCRAERDLLPVIPYPQIVEFNHTEFNLKRDSISYEIWSRDDASVDLAMQDLASLFDGTNEIKLEKGNDRKNQLVLGIVNQEEEFDRLCSKNHLLPLNPNEESYKLLIKNDLILIASVSNKGLFYGIQTLKQILRGNADSLSLPGVLIDDWPDFKFRAISDDISRGPIPTLDYMKYQVRRLAEMKINTFIHYVEHVVKTNSHPEFAPEDGSFTIDEWREIADYAEKYNITVIGGFQSFGHFQNILETPEYAHLGESGSLISPVLDESYEFLESIYSEMIPAFHASIFNINCDETFDLGKEQSKALVERYGYEEVYYQHILKLYNIVKKFDKRVFMWGDILLKYPEILEKLPKDILIGTWTYDPLDSFDDYIVPIKEKGFEFWVVPGVLNSRRLYPNYYQALTNIKNFSRDGYEQGASGLVNCVWDNDGTSFFGITWYGISYGADKSWNVDAPDEKSFDCRLNRSFYGIQNSGMSRAIHKLSELSSLEPTDGNNNKVQFCQLLPDEGKQLRVSLKDWDKVVRIVDEAQNLIDASEVKYYREDVNYIQYVIDLYRTLAQERFYLMEAANHYTKAVESKVLENPFETRNLILKCIHLVDEIISNQHDLKNEYTSLWLSENQTYAFERIADRYSEKIESFEQVKTHLLESLKRFDSSKELLSKAEVQLSIAPLPGKYFREWMMVNPIDSKDPTAQLEIDYLQEMGGEANIDPKVTQEFNYEGASYRWRRVVTKYPDVVDLAEIFAPKHNNKVMYAFANIQVEEEMTVKALAGFDEGIEVFLNGAKIYQKVGNGSFQQDAYTFTLNLHKGKNNLLIKTTQTDGPWAFSFRLPKKNVRNSKNRYRIVD